MKLKMSLPFLSLVIALAIGSFPMVLLANQGTKETVHQSKNVATLQFSDGRPSVYGLKKVNSVLRTVGVRLSTVEIPESAKPILQQSLVRAVTEDEQNKLIQLFSLNRTDLLKQIELAGRTPEVHRGGFLGTREGDTAPYPKVYDMKAMTPEIQAQVLKRYGRFHINTSDNGAGIDEVMTVVSGGPFIWMYLLPDGVVVRLTVEEIPLNGPAVRLSYPGIRMHAGWMSPKQGIIVAYAHGPESFTIRFKEPGFEKAELLNTNPWADFSGDMPKVLEKVK